MVNEQEISPWKLILYEIIKFDEITLLFSSLQLSNVLLFPSISGSVITGDKTMVAGSTHENLKTIDQVINEAINELRE